MTGDGGAATRGGDAPVADVPALAVRNVGVRFGGLVALRGISFDVAEGSVHGLLGPNGSGKTTLLNAASGFVRSTGEIALFGEPLTGHPAHRRAGLGLLRTFQNPKLVQHLTVGELLRMGEYVRGVRPWWAVTVRPAADRRERIAGLERAECALGRLGLGAGLLDAPTHELPQGTLKMVDIARALMADPRVLLLDEPSSGMSEEEIVDLRARLGSLRSGGTTLVLVEHNLGLVTAVCDTVTVLNLGEVVCTGPTAEVFARPDVTDAFLGTTGGGA